VNFATKEIDDQHLTQTGIPIRNLWYMLLYVWSAWHVFDRWQSEVEKSPTLDALFALILSAQIQQRLRIGLGRDYRGEENEIYGIRGRIDFNATLKRLSLPHGRTFSQYSVFHANVAKNKIIRSTLIRLVQKGDFGIDSFHAEWLRKKLRRLVREMEGIDYIELKPANIRREQLKQKDADYRLMLSLCYLILLRQMPGEKKGEYFLPELNRDTFLLYNIYEKFVAAFYKRHLEGWNVRPQQIIQWPAETTSDYLPVMKPDLTMQHQGSGRLLILDTKFTKSSLVTGQYGNVTFNRDHLFQIYAYLKSQEDLSIHHKEAIGILLYPEVEQRLQEKVRMQGHDINWITIDLSQPWEKIKEALLSIPSSV
jgi:5-methylcytosine-specific restriction enzyme subunit McrC